MKKASEVFKKIRFAKMDPHHEKAGPFSTDDEEHYAVSTKEWEQQVKHVKKRSMQEGAVESKEKTVTVKHKTSGKELVVTAQKAKQLKQHDYQQVKEAVKDKFDIGEYDQEGDMAKSDLRSIIANAKSNPEKFTKKELFAGTEPLTKAKDDYSWVDVKTKEALTIEGCIMGHCVGRLPSYLEGVVNGTKKIYSLRDKKGIPHVTIELNKTNQVPMYNWDGSVRKEVDPSKKDVFDEIVQIKGTANTPAESYFPQIDEFLTDYSNKIGDDLKFTELPRYLPENWRNK